MGRCSSFLRLIGLDTSLLVSSAKGLRWYLRDARELRRQLRGRTDFPFGKRYPVLTERHQESGFSSGAYFHQDLLVARKIFQRTPRSHVDVGSRIDGFVAHVASFRKIEVMDLRPQTAAIPNVVFVQRDVMTQDPAFDGYTDSLSCLHAVEHFGLGRYGDRIDADGHLRGIDNLTRMLKPGGILYLSAPIGPQRIEFNAHRVFSLGYLLAVLEPRFDILGFSYVDDRGDLHEDAVLTPDGIETNFGCRYGCGIFELEKNDRS